MGSGQHRSSDVITSLPPPRVGQPAAGRGCRPGQVADAGAGCRCCSRRVQACLRWLSPVCSRSHRAAGRGCRVTVMCVLGCCLLSTLSVMKPAVCRLGKALYHVPWQLTGCHARSPSFSDNSCVFSVCVCVCAIVLATTVTSSERETNTQNLRTGARGCGVV